MNNKTIDLSIEDVQQQVLDQQEEIDRTQKFYLNYTATEYSTYFLWHESGQLYDSERLLRLKYRSPEDEPTIRSVDESEILLSPQDSWKFFLQTRLNELGF